MKQTIYFDHAATTPLDRRVLEKMLPYFMENFGNADSPHAFGRKAMSAVDSARDKIAELINARKNEVYFTSGGTESDNWALLGGAYAKRREGKTHIVVSAIEHHAVLSAAERLEKEGFTVTYLPVNEGGRVETNALENAITPNTALVCLMAANNETGVLQPVGEAERLAHAVGALFFTDAVQLAPYAPVDVKKLNADMLAFSAHKFYGPKGVGVLYIKNGVKIEKLVGGGEQERGLRGGTVNVPAVVGLAEAYALARAETEETNAKLRRRKELFLKEISALDGVHINGDSENALPSVLNLRFDGVENTAFLYAMDLKGVCLAAGSACASASVKPSHVLTAMGLTEQQAKNSVRFSFGKNNTEAEILRGAELTKETVERLRGFAR
ncbi:MAG: cysteine desulfurase [Clostridia bacterium]|nr:cysteine desulfurase [Clostridia bacterium]